MILRNIGLTVSYCGSRFAGWQIQNNARTVQGVLEAALADLAGQTIRIYGSGRTDSGVHALEQTAAFKIEGFASIPSAKFADALNARLPADARVLKSFEKPLNFDPRRHAIRRSYTYSIALAPSVTPMQAPFVWAVYKNLNIARLNQLAALFLGDHDFSAFCSKQDLNKNKRRTIYVSRFIMQGPLYIYCIEGNAFLMNMVRRIVGCLLTMAEQAAAQEYIKHALQQGASSVRLGETAPAQGLCLQRVFY